VTCGAAPGWQACAVELLTVTKMSIATSTSRSGTATIARVRAIRRAPCRLVPPGSDSVRGAPSFQVSLVKIENIDASRGSQPCRSLSILASTRCWLAGKLTAVDCPGKARRNFPGSGSCNGSPAG
jgi:hypothetical protein